MMNGFAQSQLFNPFAKLRCGDRGQRVGAQELGDQGTWRATCKSSRMIAQQA